MRTVINEVKGVCKAIGDYSYVVKVSRREMVFCSGLTGLDESGKLVAGGLGAQARQAFRRLRQVLKAADATPEDVVRLNVYLTTFEGIEDYNAASREFFKGKFPPCTLVRVAGLWLPDMLVEIEATAVLD